MLHDKIYIADQLTRTWTQPKIVFNLASACFFPRGVPLIVPSPCICKSNDWEQTLVQESSCSGERSNSY